MTQTQLKQLKKALSSLKKGFKESPNDLERDGIIQRFEFSLELCWKTAKKVLRKNDIEIDVPKAIFREMAQLNWIETAENWILFINARNKASHIYNEEMAQEVFSVIPEFIESAEKLIKTLETKNS